MRTLSPDPAAPTDLAAAYALPETTPWLRANMIVSVDGRASIAGRSGGLGNDDDRELLGLLRSLADVVLVGSATVRSERYGPATLRAERRAARVGAGRSPHPAVAVVSSRLDLDLDAELYADPSTIVITSGSVDDGLLAAARARCTVVTAGSGPSVDLADAVGQLQARGLGRILCEGGPGLLGRVTAAGLLDELCLSVAPVLAGGDGPGLIGAAAPLRQLHLVHTLESGGMLYLRYLTDREA